MQIRFCRFVAVLGIAITPVALHAQVATVEAQVVEYVDNHNAEGMALLEQIVNINSGSMNPDGVREVGRILRAELDALGFSTEWVDGAAFDRAGHLVAERTGAGPRLLLIGHLDTVFEPDSPFQKYALLNDSTARGPGVADMKGGDVVIVQALKSGRRPRRDERYRGYDRRRRE